MSIPGLLEGMEFAVHRDTFTEQLDETVPAAETSVDAIHQDIVTEQPDETVRAPETSVDAVDIPSCLPDPADMHFPDKNIKRLAILEKEASERFPFNTIYPSVQELRSAVRIWSESVGASVSQDGIVLK